jgi:hypothetical protein
LLFAICYLLFSKRTHQGVASFQTYYLGTFSGMELRLSRSSRMQRPSDLGGAARLSYLLSAFVILEANTPGRRVFPNVLPGHIFRHRIALEQVEPNGSEAKTWVTVLGSPRDARGLRSNIISA